MQDKIIEVPLEVMLRIVDELSGKPYREVYEFMATVTNLINSQVELPGSDLDNTPGGNS